MHPRGMMRSRKFARFVCLAANFATLAGCVHPANKSTLGLPGPPVPPGDTIELISVSQSDGTSLYRTRPSHLFVHIAYDLESRSNATLFVGFEEFPSMSSCVEAKTSDGKDNTLTLVDEVSVSAHRGRHVVVLSAVWPGTTSVAPGPEAVNAGLLSLRASLSLQDPRYDFVTHRFGTEFCQRFTPVP